jgi:ribosome maturation protein Sdo1
MMPKRKTAMSTAMAMATAMGEVMGLKKVKKQVQIVIKQLFNSNIIFIKSKYSDDHLVKILKYYINP